MRSPTSLHGRLLWLLLVAIALTALVQGAVTYRSALSEADGIFDYHMKEMAQALQSGLPSSRLSDTGETLESDEHFDFVVRVWTNEGMRVFESAAHLALPQRAVMGFSNVPAHGSTYRVFSLQSRDHVIQVAQDMAVRRDMARSLAWRSVLPVAVMAPLLMLLVWWSVSFTLAPLAHVRSQLTQRRADELSEIEASGLPDELSPLILDLNALLRRLKRAFDAQGHFVAEAAHELRSPLAALKLQVHSLQRAGDEKARELALSRLSAGIERATHLVEQLLELARQETTQASSAQPVNLADIARSVIVDMAAQAAQRGVDVGLGPVTEDCVLGLSDALYILMRNLLDNAIKYAPTGGTVDLQIARSPTGVVLCVEDDGPGVAEDEQERVLDRFYRTANARPEGSGLGLAIVKAIADWHGATIQINRSPRLGGLRVSIGFRPLPAYMSAP